MTKREAWDTYLQRGVMLWKDTTRTPHRHRCKLATVGCGTVEGMGATPEAAIARAAGTILREDETT
jgi:hypothetical protein